MMIFNIMQLTYSEFQLNFISSIFNIDVAFLPEYNNLFLDALFYLKFNLLVISHV